MRVLTFNLWGMRGDWGARRHVIVRAIREARPDLVAFQEAILTDDYDQARDLVGDDYALFHQAHREPDGQGASIASRWPTGITHELDLHVTPRTEDFACVALLAEVTAVEPFGTVLFANAVPNWQLQFEVEREMQAVRIARAIEELVGVRDLHVILAGDFTADPDAASIRFLCGRQSLDGLSVCYRDAWQSVHPDDPGRTFTNLNPLLADWDWPFTRLDYVFVRCGEHGGPTLRIADCRTFLDRPVDGVWASDHFGVVADLEIPV